MENSNANFQINPHQKIYSTAALPDEQSHRDEESGQKLVGDGQKPSKIRRCDSMQVQVEVGDGHSLIDIQDIPITTSLVGIPSNHNSTQSTQSHSVEDGSSEGLHIELPPNVKSIYLNNSQSTSNNNDKINQSLNLIMKNLQVLHNKMNMIIKHFNVPIGEDTSHMSVTTTTIEDQSTQVQNQTVNVSNEQEKNHLEEQVEAGTTVLLEGFPPSYSLVQAAKEQQQQEYYALTLSSRQAQQVFKTETNAAIAATSPNELKLLKGKGVDIWVPASSHYISQIASLSDAQAEETSNELTIPIPTTSTNTVTATLPSSVVDKVFVESRSRANFAKNLTFAIFSQEERRGKNCTGRVFGKAQHKGQLDPVKLSAVKEATFRKYPCVANLVDITWRKECITAIDSGLRNENRTSALKAGNHNSVNSNLNSNQAKLMPTDHHHHHTHHELVEGESHTSEDVSNIQNKIVDEMIDIHQNS